MRLPWDWAEVLTEVAPVPNSRAIRIGATRNADSP
jgi:hypothetical protein